MKTRMALLTFAMAAAGVFVLTRTKNVPPYDLRDAVTDFTDIKVSEIKAGSSADIPMPAPATLHKDASKKKEENAYVRISVDERIPAAIADAIKISLITNAEKLENLSPDIHILFMDNFDIPNNPRVCFLSPNPARIIYLHEAKQLRYEWAPVLKKPSLFLGKKAHPYTMNIREQVEAVLDCAAFLTNKLSKNK